MEALDITSENIQVALQKCASSSDLERKQAYDYLSRCEISPDLLFILFDIFRTQIQFNPYISLQALIYAKNTIRRTWESRRSRHSFKKVIVNTTEEAKDKIKQIVLQLLQENYDASITKQIKEILKEFVWYEFPEHWEMLTKYLLCGLETAKNQLIGENSGKEVIGAISPTLKLQLDKFLSIYKIVMKQQSKKRYMTEKSAFFGLAKSFMEGTCTLLELFDSALQKIFNTTFTPSGLVSTNFNQDIITIGYSLDELVLMVLLCGFKSENLITQSEENSLELKLIKRYFEKLTCYILISKQIFNSSISDQQSSEFLKNTFKLLTKCVRGILKKTSQVQLFEPLIMYLSLEQYLNTIMEFLSLSLEPSFPEEFQHTCLLCLYRVLDTSVYITEDKTMHKYKRIEATSTKFRNFDECAIKARTSFSSFFSSSVVIGLFDLMVTKFLPLKSVSLWTNDPETFIEQEDDGFFCNIKNDKDVPISYVAHRIIEKLLIEFPEICAGQAKSYLENLVSGKLKDCDVLLQDAIYNVIEMLPKVYSEGISEDIPPIKPELFLTFLEQQIASMSVPMQAHILKRRYIILVTKWLELIDRESLLRYLTNIVKIMCETDQLILKYHCCIALRNILNFVEVKPKQYSAMRSIDEPEETIEIPIDINYSELLSSSIKVIVDVLNSFTSPALVWTSINFLTLLLEKCEYHCSEKVLQVLESSNFTNLFVNKDELVQNALMDMCQALIFSFPRSLQLIKLSASIVNTRLATSFENIEAFRSWLYILRRMNANEESVMIVKELFVSHASSMQNIVQTDIAEHMLNIVDEYLMINAFNTEQELFNIISFVLHCYKHQLSKIKKKLEKEEINKGKLAGRLSVGEAVMSILKTIIIKYIQPIGKLEGNAMIAIKPFMELILQQLASIPSAKIAECSAKFDTALIAVIGRLLVLDAQAVLIVLQNVGVDVRQFLMGWISRMDHISTHYARRLNLLGILSLLPLLGIELLQNYMGKLMEYVLPLVGNYIETKDTNGAKKSTSSTLTPTKHLSIDTRFMRTQRWMRNERKIDLYKDDTTANIEIDYYFYMKYEQLCKATNLTHVQIKNLMQESLTTVLEAIINHVPSS